MKVSRILINGLIIYIGIAAFFLVMEAAGLKDQIYLRLVNFIFVIWGVNATIKGNFKDNIDGYFTNLMAGMLTALVSLALGIISFILYAEYKGGTDYLQNFPHSYIFGGGEPEIGEFSFGLFLEGLAASMIVAFTLMQFWKDKVEKINEVDDTAHRAH